MSSVNNNSKGMSGGNQLIKKKSAFLNQPSLSVPNFNSGFYPSSSQQIPPSSSTNNKPPSNLSNQNIDPSLSLSKPSSHASSRNNTTTARSYSVSPQPMLQPMPNYDGRRSPSQLSTNTIMTPNQGRISPQNQLLPTSNNIKKSSSNTSLSDYQEAEEKISLYGKYIQKLRLELDKKSTLIRELREYIKNQDDRIRTNHDMQQKVLKYRCFGGDVPTLQIITNNSDSEEESEEDVEEDLFGNEQSGALLEEMKTKMTRFDKIANKPPPSYHDSPRDYSTHDATTQTVLDSSSNESKERELLLESINALKEATISKQVKELKDQIQYYKSLYDSVKDELTSTRSEYVQFKMKTQDDSHKTQQKIKMLSEAVKQEKESKGDVVKVVSIRYEQEKQATQSYIESLQSEINTEKLTNESLEKLIETQQHLYETLNEKYLKETTYYRKELEMMRKKLSLSTTSSVDIARNDLRLSTSNDISSILQPNDGQQQYLKTNKGGLPRL